MNTRIVRNPATGRQYSAAGPVYETPGVWCGTVNDPEFGFCFVKILHYGNRPEKEQKLALQEAQQEAEVMQRAAKCTDRIPKLYDHWHDRGQKDYVLVMQKMPGVTLKAWMQKRPVAKLDEGAVFLRSLIIRQLAQILLDIHSRIPSISHRDLKPENVMIRLDENKKWQVSLIDFGIAGRIYSVGVGTSQYQSPEHRSLQDTIPGSGEAKDVFSLGILWYELLSGKSAGQIQGEFLDDLDEPVWEMRPSLPTEAGKAHQILFEKMTEFNPDKRPTLAQVVKNIPQWRKRQ